MKKVYIFFVVFACLIGSSHLSAQNSKTLVTTSASEQPSITPETKPLESDANDATLLKLYGPGQIYREYKPEQEDLSKRDEFTKHFRNQDGSFSAVLSSGPVHYWENGGWRTGSIDIIPTHDSKFPLANLHAATKTHYGIDISSGIKMIGTQGRALEQFSPKSILLLNANGRSLGNAYEANVSAPLQSSAQQPAMVKYPDVFPSTELTVEQKRDHIKTSYTITQNIFNNLSANVSDVALVEKMHVPLGATVEKRDEEGKGMSIVVRKGDEILLTYRDAVFHDDSTHHHKVTGGMAKIDYSLTGTELEFRILIPAAWLRDSTIQYPLTIDPNLYATLTGNIGGGTTWWTGFCTNDCAWGTSGDIVCGFGDNWDFFGLFGDNVDIDGYAKFNLSTIPSGACISTADLYMYQYDWDGSGDKLRFDFGWANFEPVAATGCTGRDYINNLSEVYQSYDVYWCGCNTLTDYNEGSGFYHNMNPSNGLAGKIQMMAYNGPTDGGGRKYMTFGLNMWDHDDDCWYCFGDESNILYYRGYASSVPPYIAYTYTLPAGSTASNPISVGTLACGTTYTQATINNIPTNCYGNDVPSPQNINSSHDVWYSFSISSPQIVNISTCGSGLADTYMSLWSGSTSALLNYVASNDNNGPHCASNQASLQQTLAAGSYMVAVEGAGSNYGDITTVIWLSNQVLGTLSNSGPINFCGTTPSGYCDFTPAVTLNGYTGSPIWEWAASATPTSWNTPWVSGASSGTSCFPPKVSTSDANPDRIRVGITGCGTTTYSGTVLLNNYYNAGPTSLSGPTTGCGSGFTLTANFSSSIDILGKVEFWDGACGSGTLLASVTAPNNSSSVSYTLTSAQATAGVHTYYVRYNPNWAGNVTGCSPTTCQSKLITIYAAPDAPTTGSPTPASGTTQCAGTSLASGNASGGTNVGTGCQMEYQYSTSSVIYSSSTTASSSVINVGASTTGLVVGMSVYGTGIATDATITAINPGTGDVTLSIPCISTTASSSKTFIAWTATSPQYDNPATFTSAVSLSGNNYVRVRRTNCSGGCTSSPWTTIATWGVVAQPDAPTTASASPSTGTSACTGTLTLSGAATGGNAGVSCSIEYQYRTPATASVTSTPTGSQGSTTITLPSGTSVSGLGISTGMSVTGTGIGTNAQVVSFPSGTGGRDITLDVANSATVSGNVTFEAWTVTSPVYNTIPVISASTAGTYKIRARRANCQSGCTTSSWGILATWTVVSPPDAPTTLSQSPSSGSIVCAGSTLTLTTDATGGNIGAGCSLEYQYSTDGTNYLATSPQYNTIPSFSATVNGTGYNYLRVRRSNCSGNCAASAWTTVSWQVGAYPTSTVTATKSPNSTYTCGAVNLSVSGASQGNGVQCTLEYQHTTDNSGTPTWTYDGSSYPSFTGVAGKTSEIQVRRNCGGCGTSGWQSLATWYVTALPVGYNLANPINLGTMNCTGFTDTKNNVATNCFGDDYNSGGGWTNQSSDDIFYKFHMNYTGRIAITNCGSGFDTYIHLLNSSGTMLAENDNPGSTPASCNSYTTGEAYLEYDITSAGDYYVVVEGKGSATGSIVTGISLVAPTGTISSGGGSTYCADYAGAVFTISGAPAGTSFTWAYPGIPSSNIVASGTQASVTFTNSVSTTGTGSSGGRTITVASTSGISTGMSVKGVAASGTGDGTGIGTYVITLTGVTGTIVAGQLINNGVAGDGIPAGAYVSSVAGNAVTFSASSPLSANPVGTVNFSPIGFGAQVISISGNDITVNVDNLADFSGINITFSTSAASGTLTASQSVYGGTCQAPSSYAITITPNPQIMTYNGSPCYPTPCEYVACQGVVLSGFGLTSSQSGVTYSIVDSSNTGAGTSVSGTGSSISLATSGGYTARGYYFMIQGAASGCPTTPMLGVVHVRVVAAPGTTQTLAFVPPATSMCSGQSTGMKVVLPFTDAETKYQLQVNGTTVGDTIEGGYAHTRSGAGSVTCSAITQTPKLQPIASTSVIVPDATGIIGGGVNVGMYVTCASGKLAAGVRVTSVDGNLLTLSAAPSSAFDGTTSDNLTFGAAVTGTASTSTGAYTTPATLTMSTSPSTLGISIGMRVSGHVNLGNNPVVYNISGNTVYLTTANLGTVSGSLTFSPPCVLTFEEIYPASSGAGTYSYNVSMAKSTCSQTSASKSLTVYDAATAYNVKATVITPSVTDASCGSGCGYCWNNTSSNYTIGLENAQAGYTYRLLRDGTYVASASVTAAGAFNFSAQTLGSSGNYTYTVQASPTTSSFSLSATTVAGQNKMYVPFTGSISQLNTGMYITGPSSTSLLYGTTITNIGTFEYVKPATATYVSSTTMTVSSVSGISLGMLVYGTNVGANAYVIGINGTTITVSGGTLTNAISNVSFSGWPITISADALSNSPANTTKSIFFADCLTEMTGYVSVAPGPQVYTVSADPSTVECAGSEISVKLSSSNEGVYYQLVKNGSLNVGNPVPGGVVGTTSGGGTVTSTLSVTPTTTGGAASSPTLIVSSSSNISIGMNVTGASGLGGNAYVTNITPLTTRTPTGSNGGSGSYSFTVSVGTGIVVGMQVSGTNIPSNSIVTAVSGTTITINQPLTGTVSGTVTFSGATITLNTNNIGLIAEANTVTFTNHQITFDAITSTTGTEIYTVTATNGGCSNTTPYVNGARTGNTASGVTPASITISGTNVNDVAVGMSVTGTNVGSGAYVTAVNTGTGVVSVSVANTGNVSSPTFTISSPTVTATPTASAYPGSTITLSSVSGIIVGMKVSGTGIGNGATVSSINFGTGVITLSVANTSSVSGTVSFTVGTPVTINVLPTDYAMTTTPSSGTGCGSVTIGLTGSESGVDYQLQNNGTNTGSAVAGTGSAISLGSLTTSGNYSVVATNSSTSCSRILTSATATGISGGSTITVTAISGGNLANIETGMSVSGTGIASGATVTGVAGSVVDLSTANTGAVSGTVTFRKVVTVNASPAAYTVGPATNAYCSGGSTAITLSNSESGVDYQLYNGTSLITTLSGTGSGLSFSGITDAGTYTITGVNATSGCSTTMTGNSTVTVNAAPSVFNVSSTGTLCENSGAVINLSGTESGVSYQLLLDGANSGSAYTGNGSSYSFSSSLSSADGAYTVKATTANGCSATMNGSVNVAPGPDIYNVTPASGGSFCPGVGLDVGLDGSTSGTNYQLYNSGSATGSAVSGTGSSFSFGTQAAAGTYTVVATDNSSGCSASMTNSPVLTDYGSPTVYTVTGGGAACSGVQSTFAVGLSGSQSSSYTYQLYKDGSASGMPSLSGTNGALNFGNYSTGTYTVVATSNNNCTADMSGNAVVSVTTTPAQPTLTPAANPACGNTIIVPSISGAGAIYYQGTTSGGTDTSVTTTATGTSGQYTVTVASNTGIKVGMTASGTGIATDALVTNIAGTTITLSDANTAAVSGSVEFTARTSSQYVNTTGTNTYYFRALNGNCWGPEGSVSVTINALPATPVVTDQGGVICSSDILSASNGGDGVIYWQGNVPDGNDATLGGSPDTVYAEGTYYYQAKNLTTGCWSASGSFTVDLSSLGVVAVTSNCLNVSTYTTVSTTGSGGSSGGTTFTVASATDIYVGMEVTGTNIQPGTTVTGIAGTTITVSLQLTGSVSGSVTFAPVDNAYILLSGTGGIGPYSFTPDTGGTLLSTASNATTATAYGTSGQSSIVVKSSSGLSTGMIVSGTGIGTNSAITSITSFSASTTGSGGGAGTTQFTVASASGIVPGMGVSGAGIGSNAQVTAVAGTTITVNVNNTGAVSGTLSFSGVTLALSVANTAAVGGTITFTSYTSIYEQALLSGLGGTATFTVTDNVGCTAQQTVTATPGHPVDIPYKNHSGTAISTQCFLKSFNKWLTFRDPSNTDNALLSVNDRGIDLGRVTVRLYRDSTEPTIKNVHNAANGGDGSCVDYAMSALKRHFVITADNQPSSGTVGIRLYFSKAELDTLAITTMASYSVPCDAADDDSGSTTLERMTYLHVTKYHGSNEDGDFSNNTPLSSGGIYKLYGPNNASAPLDASVANGFKDLFSGAQNTNGHNYLELSVSDLSEFWISASNGPGTPLPVEMLFLEAEAMDNTYIQVRWATALEINNAYFDVERSTDAQNWTKIGQVAGHGNATTRNDYHLNDYNVTPGVRYYYRLKQVDFDLQFEYTDIVSAIINATISFEVKDFIPNPTMDQTSLIVVATKEQEIKVDLYDILGRQVMSGKHQINRGGNQIDFNLGHLASGTYTAVVSSANEIYTKKIVLTH